MTEPTSYLFSTVESIKDRVELNTDCLSGLPVRRRHL